MSDKVIFIDIDGPLSYGKWMDGEVEIEVFRNSTSTIKIPYQWVEEDCNALSEIIIKTNADVVVSSDWKKFYTLRDLKAMFAHYGIDESAIIDTTTHYNPIRKLSSPTDWDRACEIKSWVKTFRPKHWIAIDDIPLGYYFKQLGIPKWKHVAVDGGLGKGGKLRDKVNECIKKLNR